VAHILSIPYPFCRTGRKTSATSQKIYRQLGQPLSSVYGGFSIAFTNTFNNSDCGMGMVESQDSQVVASIYPNATLV
jgi:hypothetical protein